MSNQKLSTKETLIQIAKFVAFSMGAGIIQIVSYTIIHELTDCAHIVAYLPSLTLSVLYNFTVNRKFTFKSATNVPVAMLKVFGYYCVFTPLSIWWGVALTNIGWNEYLVLALTMAVNMSTEFLFNRFVVFGKSINTAETKEKKE